MWACRTRLQRRETTHSDCQTAACTAGGVFGQHRQSCPARPALLRALAAARRPLRRLMGVPCRRPSCRRSARCRPCIYLCSLCVACNRMPPGRQGCGVRTGQGAGKNACIPWRSNGPTMHTGHARYSSGRCGEDDAPLACRSFKPCVAGDVRRRRWWPLVPAAGAPLCPTVHACPPPPPPPSPVPVPNELPRVPGWSERPQMLAGHGMTSRLAEPTEGKHACLQLMVAALKTEVTWSGRVPPPCILVAVEGCGGNTERQGRLGRRQWQDRPRSVGRRERRSGADVGRWCPHRGAGRPAPGPPLWVPPRPALPLSCLHACPD